jgi:nitrogen regulatory protein PII
MPTTSAKLITIIAEDELEERLERDVLQLGARGYTVVRVRGEGLHGARKSEWEGENIRIEAVVSPEVAQRILDHLATKYFAHFAVVAYVSTVEVVRAEKFL